MSGVQFIVLLDLWTARVSTASTVSTVSTVVSPQLCLFLSQQTPHVSARLAVGNLKGSYHSCKDHMQWTQVVLELLHFQCPF